MTRYRTALASLVMLALLTMGQRPAAAQEYDPAGKSAVYLLQSTMRMHRDGMHHRLLRALRHLEDPALKPLFEALAFEPHRDLQVHGELGLAEASPNHSFELARLAEISDPAVLTMIVSHGLTGEMLTIDQAVEMMGWPDLDPGVRLVLSGYVLQAKPERFNQEPFLRDILASPENPGREALAALFLAQLGDRDARARLDALLASDSPRRDEMCASLLRTALRCEFTKVKDWVLQVAKTESLPEGLRRLALRTALQFGATGAQGVWKQWYTEAGEVAAELRMALMALQESPYVDPSLFQPMLQSERDMVRQMGKTGQAVASGENVPEAVVALIEHGHQLANQWALVYANEHGEAINAQTILLGLILAADEDDPAKRARLLDVAMEATQVLVDKDVDSAMTILQPLMRDDQYDEVFRRAILMGLIRSKSKGVEKVVEGVKLTDRTNKALAAVLRAREGRTLDDEQMETLRLAVRGSSGVPMALRVQAAWVYLKLTGQADRALADLTGP